jgi:group I intron endonuclease
MEKHYIYKLTSPSNKIYIGRTVDFNSRMMSHNSSANRGKKRPIYDAIRKYGWESFNKEIIAEVNGDEIAYKTELFYINLFDSVNSGYNLSVETSHGGDNWKERKETPEFHTFKTKMKILNNSSTRMHGKNHSDEAKAKQKAAAIGRYSLDWFIQRYGTEEGTIKYEDRRLWLKTRNLKKDENGRFIKN